MPNDRPLVISGAPASGKSTLAPRVARALGYRHVDLDDEIAVRAGMRPGTLLAKHGEATLRALESLALREVIAQPRVVVAVGGGALVERRLRHDVLRRATVVTLSAPAPVLLERMRDGEARPLVTHAPDPSAALEALLQTRAMAYAEAHLHADSAANPPDALVDAVRAVHTRAPLLVPLGHATQRVEVGSVVDAKSTLVDLAGGAKTLLVTDRHVAQAMRGRGRVGMPAVHREIAIPPGEPHKTLSMARRVWDALLALGADRDSLVLARGGGVVTDLAGFAAATYLRGVRYVSLPTSLLAMVDASVGGKTAVNHPRGKNLLGAFHHPSLVWIDPAYTSTLPVREWRAGMAEVVKMAATLDAALLATIEQHAEALSTPPPREGDDPHRALREDVIRATVQAKIDVVARDEREAGARRLLNFGHTVGHGIEHASRYRLRHGEAVAVGMMAAMELGVREGVTPPALRDRVGRLLDALGLPLRAKVPQAAVSKALRHDKKRAHDTILGVLLTGEGAAEVRSLPIQRFDAVLDCVT